MKKLNSGFLAGMMLAALCAAPAGPSFAAGEDTAIVIRVIDANTIVLKGGQEVRLIGVRSPSALDADRNNALAKQAGLKTESLADVGRQAKEFVEYLVQGQTVRLELDPGLASINHRDREGRILAYVWFTTPIFAQAPDWLVMDPSPKTPQDAFLNAAVMRAGYAALETDWPFAFGGKFLALQEEAKKSNRGMWQQRISIPPAPPAPKPGKH
ncbi:MAG TPA: thermonuclease family protein [Verrucomicrobiae bacterium]|jgi:endonuclease YncB( thermonuclease family)|nr:thermonuclease family protein [Verrucomicrobiae bacterium]